MYFFFVFHIRGTVFDLISSLPRGAEFTRCRGIHNILYARTLPENNKGMKMIIRRFKIMRVQTRQKLPLRLKKAHHGVEPLMQFLSNLSLTLFLSFHGGGVAMPDVAIVCIMGQQLLREIERKKTYFFCSLH